MYVKILLTVLEINLKSKVFGIFFTNTTYKIVNHIYFNKKQLKFFVYNRIIFLYKNCKSIKKK